MSKTSVYLLLVLSLSSCKLLEFVPNEGFKDINYRYVGQVDSIIKPDFLRESSTLIEGSVLGKSNYYWVDYFFTNYKKREKKPTLFNDI